MVENENGSMVPLEPEKIEEPEAGNCKSFTYSARRALDA